MAPVSSRSSMTQPFKPGSLLSNIPSPSWSRNFWPWIEPVMGMLPKFVVIYGSIGNLKNRMSAGCAGLVGVSTGSSVTALGILTGGYALIGLGAGLAAASAVVGWYVGKPKYSMEERLKSVKFPSMVNKALKVVRERETHEA